MLTCKQKEAIKVVLDLHKKGDVTNEQVMTVIEAMTENTVTYYYPWVTSVPYFQSEPQPYTPPSSVTFTSNEQKIE